MIQAYKAFELQSARKEKFTKFIVNIGKTEKGNLLLTTKLAIAEQYHLAKLVLRAKELLALVAKGQKPGDENTISKKGSVTLKQAWDRYKNVHMKRKGLSTKTLNSYQDHVERLFKDWLEKPLAELSHDPAIVAQRHDDITKTNGPYIANGSMRTLRLIYNHAKKANLDLPEKNPTTAVDWNEEKRRDSGMSENEIRSWFTELYKLNNPLRREFHLFLLLSGSRPTAIKAAKIEHINFKRRILFCPSPKGGEKKAFEIPLSMEMIRCLIRTVRLARIVTKGDKPEWLFPSSDTNSGHVNDQREKRKNLSKWGNELRQTYRNLGVIAGIDHLNMHLLMNHSLPGVNAGYITRNRLTETVLRKFQQAISDVVMEEVAKDDKAEARQDESMARKNTMTIMNWLKSSRITLSAMSKSSPSE